MPVVPISAKTTQVPLSVASLKAINVNMSRSFLRLVNKDIAATITYKFGSDFVVPQNEIQKVAFSAPPTAGVWKLSTAGGQVTAALQFNDNAATIQAALEALPEIGVGNVVVGGDYAAGFTLTFAGTLLNKPVNLLSVVQSTLTDNTIDKNEVQKIAFANVPDAGIWAMSFGVNNTTDLAFNANAAAVEAALQLVPGLDGVTVAGDYAVGFTVTFAGSQAAAPQPLLTVFHNTLTNATNNQSEIQTIYFAPQPDAGSFKLMFGGQTTAVLPFNAQAGDVQGALEALNNIGVNNVDVAGSMVNGFVVTFQGALANLSQALITPQANQTLTQPPSGSYGLTRGAGSPLDVYIRTVRTQSGVGPVAAFITVTETTLGVAPGPVNGVVTETQAGIADPVEGEVLLPGKSMTYEVAVPVDAVWAKASAGTPVLEITEG